MIKALFRYILVFGILLSSGYSQLYAHSSTGSFNSLTETHSTLGNATLQANSAVKAFIYVPLSSERKKQTDISDVAEVKAEEDEVHLSKKSVSGRNYSTVSFDAQSAVYFFHYLKHQTSQRKQISYHSSTASRIVVFGVFRI